MSNMFYTLSTSLAQATGQDEVVCRGVLRITIINSTKHLQQTASSANSTTETLEYIKKMTYQDWKSLIEGPQFSRMLARIGVKETSALTARLMQTLVEQQSLFTMAAR